MAYGDKRGMKDPGEYGVGDYFLMGSSGAIGIMAATLADLNQRGEASALFQISIFTTRLTGIEFMPFYVILLALMSLGALSIFFFQPLSMREAFLQGFGVLAGLMTILPANYVNAAPPEMPEATTTEQQVEAKIISGLGQQETAFPESVAPTNVALQQSSEAIGYSLVIRVEFPEGLREDLSQMIRRGALRGRLYNEQTKTSYDLFRNGGADASFAGNVLTIRTTIPGLDAQAKLWTRIEARGYAIALESFEASKGGNGAWSISMTPSDTPIFLQRLTNPYWF
ncbi:hypothetical protein [Parvularcula sp. IMCC14364]|uniref:hypothetical protein n=1 Tax=Parvularcula sp. IMCC14364 TaxID=3067902 RepID=UPI0027417C56|nr:hypothetical protein [Parvularcula sp. IMCC14364]